MESKKASKRFLYTIVIVATLAELIRGFDLMVVAGALIFLGKEFDLSAVQQGFAVGSALLGCIFGALIGGEIGDLFGRKRTLYLTALFYGVSAVGTALPHDFTTFCIFRIIGGIGVGFASVVAPMYIAEVSPAKIRGKLITMTQLSLITGSLISIILAWRLASVTEFQFLLTPSAGNWRWMFASELIPIILFAICLFFVPPSPRWLMIKGRTEEARRVLVKIAGTEKADTLLKEIKSSLTRETGTFSELFEPGIRKALFIALVLSVVQQFCGVDTIMLYSPVIFQSMGITNAADAIFRLVIIQTWMIFATVLSYILVDRWGRRPLLLFGSIAMAVGHILLGYSFHQGVFGLRVLLYMFILIGAYIMTIAAVYWVFISEIFPNRIRGKAISLAVFTLWGSSYLVKQFFPPAKEYIKELFGSEAGLYWFYAAVCVFAFFFCWKMIPETKGRTLEEIGRSWTKET